MSVWNHERTLAATQDWHSSPWDRSLRQDLENLLRVTQYATSSLVLEIYGLDEKWEDGVKCEYEDPIFFVPDDDDDDFDNEGNLPYTVRRARYEVYVAEYNARRDGSESYVGRSMVEIDDASSDEEEERASSESEIDGVRIEKSFDFEYFRSKLIEDFHIEFRRNRVIWPRSDRMNYKDM